MAETDKIIELGREPGFFFRSVFNTVYTLLVLKYYIKTTQDALMQFEVKDALKHTIWFWEYLEDVMAIKMMSISQSENVIDEKKLGEERAQAPLDYG